MLRQRIDQLKEVLLHLLLSFMVNFGAFLKYLLDLFIRAIKLILGALILDILVDSPSQYHVNIELTGLFHWLHEFFLDQRRSRLFLLADHELII